MTPLQEQHLKEIQTITHLLINDKYRRGQIEHGDNLFDKSAEDLIDEAIDEAIDQIVFLLTAKANLLTNPKK